jgi:hypothetical protein
MYMPGHDIDGQRGGIRLHNRRPIKSRGYSPQSWNQWATLSRVWRPTNSGSRTDNGVMRSRINNCQCHSGQLTQENSILPLNQEHPIDYLKGMCPTGITTLHPAGELLAK